MAIVISDTLSESVIAGMSVQEIQVEILKQLQAIKQVASEDVILLPEGYSYETPNNASSPQTITPEPLLTSHFILQNNGATGSGNLLVGNQNVQAISISPGNMLLYSFNLVNYKTDLNKWYVSCTTKKQPYSLITFYQA